MYPIAPMIPSEKEKKRDDAGMQKAYTGTSHEPRGEVVVCLRYAAADQQQMSDQSTSSKPPQTEDETDGSKRMITRSGAEEHTWQSNE